MRWIRARRQVAMAIWLTKPSSVGVAGWCSASRRSRKASKAAGSSPGRMRVSAYRPYLRLLRRTAARPSGVDGPVLFWALRRLASICRCDDMAHLRRDYYVGFLLLLAALAYQAVAGNRSRQVGVAGIR